MFRKKFLLLYTLSVLLSTWAQPAISQNSMRQNKSRMTQLRERALKFGRCVVGTREFRSEEKQVARATFLLLIGCSLGGGYLLKRLLQRHVPSGPPSSSESDSTGEPASEPADMPSPPPSADSSSSEDEEDKAEEGIHRKEEEIPLRWEWVRGGFWDPNRQDPEKASWTRATFTYFFGR